MSDPIINQWTRLAREQHDLPDNWYGWIFEAVPGTLLVTGAECPLKTRGPDKGGPNYHKADQSTKLTVAIDVPAGED